MEDSSKLASQGSPNQRHGSSNRSARQEDVQVKLPGLFLMLTALGCASLSAFFLILPVALDRYNQEEPVPPAILQASLFISGLTSVATLQVVGAIVLKYAADRKREDDEFDDEFESDR